MICPRDNRFLHSYLIYISLLISLLYRKPHHEIIEQASYKYPKYKTREIFNYFQKCLVAYFQACVVE